MTIRAALAATAIALVLAVPGAHASPPENAYGVSDAAFALAVRGEDGKPLGAGAYETPHDALKAGDTAAFLLALRDESVDRAGNAWPNLLLAIDAAAGEQFGSANDLLDEIDLDAYGSALTPYVRAWVTALEGNEDDAISEIRDAGNVLPGMVAEFALASMLEAYGRNDEALAVYASLIPNEIVAPEHSFDVKGIVWTDVKEVIRRRTLLLRKLGRIKEAQATYQLLADAEPEKAASYASVIASLEDDSQYDDEDLTLPGAFSRSLIDLRDAMHIQRLIQAAMVGADRDFGYDETNASLEQIALVLDPENEGIRSRVIASLHREALFDGAAHVALAAPEQTAAIKVAAARTQINGGDHKGASATLADALEIVEEADRLSIIGDAIGLYALLDDDKMALKLAAEAFELADNDGKLASAHALKAGALEHFARYDEALEEAQKALELDDTHSRRMTVANLLGDVGRAEEGHKMMQRELIERPNDPYMMNTLGYFLITKTDKYEEGYRALVRADALTRDDPYIDDSLGWAKYKLGHLKAARTLIEQSRAELQPHYHWEIEDHLGDIYWHLGEEDKAREAWEKSLDEHPPRRVARLVKEKLANGLTTPAPEKRDLPKVELESSEQSERDI